ncbi:MAG: hypothetical protein ACUVRD_08900 [Bacteroidia bacterium]
MSTWKKWLSTLLGQETKTNTQDYPSPPITTPDAQAYYRVREIQEWISKNISPYAWDRVALRLYPDFVKEKISPLNLTSDTKISAALLLRIYEEIRAVYGISIPSEVTRVAEINQKVPL